MDLNTQIKNLVGNRYFHDEKSLSRWIYHNNKFSTVKKSKIPCFAIQKIERVFTRLIVDFKKNHSEAEVDDSTLESLKKFENLVHEKVLDYKSKHGKVYLFFCRLFFGSIDKLSQELIDEIKKLQKRHENLVNKEQPTPYSIDDELKDNVQHTNFIPYECEENLSEEEVDYTPSLVVDNDIEDNNIEEEIEEIDFKKAQFEFICSDGKSYFISIEQQKLLAEKSNYFKTIFFGGLKESCHKLCELPTISKNDLQDLINVSLDTRYVYNPQRAYELLFKGDEIGLRLPACENRFIYHIKRDYDPQDLEDFQNIKDIIQTLPLHYVSEQLKETINDYLVKAYLHHSRTADIQNESKQTCLDLMASLDIKSLNLNNLSIIDEELSELIKCYPNLLSLSISGGKISNQGVIEGIGSLKQLTSLNLGFCEKLTDQAVIDGISKLKQLTSLNLNWCSQLTDQAVIDGISKLEQLNSLNVSMCYELTDQAVIDGISKLKQLTSLGVSGCYKLTDRAVIGGISKLEQLTNLDLKSCIDLTDEGVIDGLGKLKQLTSLAVGHCRNLTDRAVIEGISILRQLISLDVVHCDKLTDRAVIEGISKLERLTSLDVSFCEMLTDRAVIDGISKLEQLSRLNLSCCQNLTDKGVIDGLGKFKHLKDLNLLNCPSITEEIKKVLSPSIPYILYHAHK